MKHFIINLVRKVFSIEDLIESIEEKISDMIDYDDLADMVLDQVDVPSIIQEIAEEEIMDL